MKQILSLLLVAIDIALVFSIGFAQDVFPDHGRNLEENKKAEAAEVKVREQKIAELDQQIAALRKKLGGTGPVDASMFEQLMSLVRQNETLAKEIVDIKRKAELERRRLEQESTLINDIAKYEEIAAGERGKELKEGAWDALLGKYNLEKGSVKTGDITAFKEAVNSGSVGIKNIKNRFRDSVMFKDAIAKGGGAGTEEAVLLALRWLARHQNADGSWRARDFSLKCKNGPCTGPGYEENDIGVTGLAVMAFLGAGYTHLSRDKYDGISFGEVVKKGLKWLIDVQDSDGCIGRQAGKFMYNHCIGTLALVEAYGMTESPLFKEYAQKGLDFISVAQNPFLAWRYQVKPGDNDTSVTGWAVMAMKSARMTKDLKVPQSGFDGAYAWIEKVTDETYYSVGYTFKGTGKVYVKDFNEDWTGHEALTAVGMLCRIFIKSDKKDPALEGGARLLIKDLPLYDISVRTEKPIDYYYWYYATLAMFQYDGPDGKYWKTWNQAMKDAIVPSQRKEKDGCSWGSWDVEVDRWAFEGGRVYSTAINALTLETYYRYPSAFAVVPADPKAVKVVDGGQQAPDKGITPQWKLKLDAADELRIEGDKEYAKGEDQGSSSEDRIKAYEKAQKMTSDARDIYEAFCMEYEEDELSGYDDKYDKASKRIKDIKFKIEEIKRLIEKK